MCVCYSRKYPQTASSLRVWCSSLLTTLQIDLMYVSFSCLIFMVDPVSMSLRVFVPHPNLVVMLVLCLCLFNNTLLNIKLLFYCISITSLLHILNKIMIPICINCARSLNSLLFNKKSRVGRVNTPAFGSRRFCNRVLIKRD